MTRIAPQPRCRDCDELLLEPRNSTDEDGSPVHYLDCSAGCGWADVRDGHVAIFTREPSAQTLYENRRRLAHEAATADLKRLREEGGSYEEILAAERLEERLAQSE